MKREVPLTITAVVGIVYIFQYFVPHEPVSRFSDWFSDWFGIIQAFAIWLGALNLMKLSLIKVSKRKEDWIYSLVTVISFATIFVVGLFFSGGASFQEPGTRFMYIYDNVYDPLSSTMFAILAFFVASASYRAFRARNKEATMLLLAAFFVMLGRVPIGDLVTREWLSLPNWLWLSNWADWVMNIPNMAGQRAIMIGIALGIMSTSLRIILGIERTFVSGD
jgi:hypothetical protein